VITLLLLDLHRTAGVGAAGEKKMGQTTFGFRVILGYEILKTQKKNSRTDSYRHRTNMTLVDGTNFALCVLPPRKW
jgi:hypothetical protein